jgi:tetratricopeptide (TPR) repeat protein
MITNTLIEKYFSGSLTKKEHLDFEKLYNSDSEFKNEVDFLKNIKRVSEKEDDNKFRNELKTFESEFISKNKNPLVKWLKPFIAVAAVLLIALYINLMYNTPINEEQLFTYYFEPSKNVSAPIVRSENQSNTTNAFIFYSEKNYNKAYELFDALYKSSKNSEFLFYQGNALLALGNTNEAIEKFKEHLNHSDLLTNRSHWYLALAYLKTKEVALAKQELNALINSGESFKKSEASALLKKLE